MYNFFFQSGHHTDICAMNRPLLFVLLLTLSLPCLAQTDTLYFDSSWIRTNASEAVYYSVRTPAPGGHNVEDHFMSNGKVQMTGFYLAADSDVSDGPFKFFYENGMLKSEGNYKKGERDGVWYAYDKKGIQEAIMNYKEGKYDGMQTYYYTDTAVVWYKEHFHLDKPDGELTSYYKDGTLKRREYHKADDTAVTGKCYDLKGKEIPFTPFFVMPHTSYDLQQYLGENTHYPRSARRKNITGRAIVRFTVTEDGHITNVHTIHHVSPEIDAAAEEVIMSMPAWMPGKRDDEPVAVYFTQPLSFKLE
jgi:TonB family protein